MVSAMRGRGVVAETVRSKRAQTRMGGIVLDGDRIRYKGQEYPLAGAHARVEASGQIDRRVSLTRFFITLGLAALIWKKKDDHREVFLTVAGPGFEIVTKVHPDDQALARAFAARINTAAAA